MQGDSMESSGVVTIIREARIPAVGPVSDGRKKIITPNLQTAIPQKAPSTREEVLAFQITAVEMVAAKLKEGLIWGEANDVDIAVESAKKVRGVWPKAEFLALLNSELLFKAIPEFERIEAFRAVA